MSRPITAQLFTSVDLVVGEPQTWHFPYVGPALLAEVEREQSTTTLLLGRRTYDVFASSWPERDDDVPLAAQLNGMRKVVVSDSISAEEARWANSTVLAPDGDLAGALESLDELGAERITVAGSISLVEQLLALGRLDELRLIVHPLIVGTGRRLFDGWTSGQHPLTLADSVDLDHGTRMNVYSPR